MHNYLPYIEHGLNQYITHAFSSKRKYIDYFFSLKCASDLMALGVFPDAKEITEALAMYNAVIKSFRKQLDITNHNVVVHVVADGSTPRLGALLAFLTKWHIVSIDPQMKDVWTSNHAVNRLICVKDKVENVKLNPPDIVLLCHPHVDYPTIRSIYPTQPLIVMTCCVPWPRDLASKTYIDHGVWSPKNEVYIYR